MRLRIRTLFSRLLVNELLKRNFLHHLSQNVFRDEIVKIPLGRQGCLPMVTSSAFGESSPPQNPAVGQKAAPTATSWGWGRIYGIAEMTICKLSHRFCRGLVNNDNPTLSHIGSHPDFWAFCKEADSANLVL